MNLRNLFVRLALAALFVLTSCSSGSHSSGSNAHSKNTPYSQPTSRALRRLLASGIERPWRLAGAPTEGDASHDAWLDLSTCEGKVVPREGMSLVQASVNGPTDAAASIDVRAFPSEKAATVELRRQQILDEGVSKCTTLSNPDPFPGILRLGSGAFGHWSTDGRAHGEETANCGDVTTLVKGYVVNGYFGGSPACGSSTAAVTLIREVVAALDRATVSTPPRSTALPPLVRHDWSVTIDVSPDTDAADSQVPSDGGPCQLGGVFAGLHAGALVGVRASGYSAREHEILGEASIPNDGRSKPSGDAGPGSCTFDLTIAGVKDNPIGGYGVFVLGRFVDSFEQEQMASKNWRVALHLYPQTFASARTEG